MGRREVGFASRENPETKRAVPDDSPSWRRPERRRALPAWAGQAKLEVGAVDDPAEREADRIADQVIRSLAAPAPAEERGEVAQRIPVTRIARREAAGAAGGELDPATERDLQAARATGQPLEPTVRRRMEGAFGADFSGVRVHTGPVVDDLGSRIQARAFTLGSDVFVRRSDWAPHTGEGERLLAHELAHTVQQGGAGVRRSADVVRRQPTVAQVTGNLEQPLDDSRIQAKAAAGTVDWFDPKTFKELTATRGHRRGQALRAIDSYLVAYRGLLPRNLEGKQRLLLQMQYAAEQWILQHSAMDSADERVTGTKSPAQPSGQYLIDPSRKKRFAGMAGFHTAVGTELQAVQTALQPAKRKDIQTLDQASAAHQKLKDKYTGDPSSMFAKLGTIVDLAVPNAGDGSSLEVAFRWPVDPTGTAFVGGTLRLRAENDSPPGSATGNQSAKNILTRMELVFTFGAQLVDVARLQGEVGGYFEASGRSGAECMTLLSYGLYRKFRESLVVPSGMTNLLWGGQKGRFGAIKAEQWSKGVEQSVFQADEIDEQTGQKTGNKKDTGAYVEHGLLGGVSGFAGVRYGDTVTGQTGGSVTLSTGKRYDVASIDAAKGTRGQGNVPTQFSGLGAKNQLAANAHGTAKQASLGARTIAMVFQVDGSIGPFAGSVDVRLQWMRSEDPNSPNPGPKLRLSAAELRFGASLSMPPVGAERLGENIAAWSSMGVERLASVVRAGIEGKEDRASKALTDSEKKQRGATSGVGEGFKTIYDTLALLQNIAPPDVPAWTDPMSAATSASGWGAAHAGNVSEALGTSNLGGAATLDHAQAAASKTALSSGVKIAVSLGISCLEKNIQLAFSFERETNVAIPLFLDVRHARSTRLIALNWQGRQWKGVS